MQRETVEVLDPAPVVVSDDEVSEIGRESMNRGVAHAVVSSDDPSISAQRNRQHMWDQQLESVDQKQAELLTIQWKLIREQVGTLAHEMALIQGEVKDFKTGSRRALGEVEKRLHDTDSKLTEEKSLRVAMFEGLEKGLNLAKLDFETEAKQRAAADKDTHVRLETLCDQLEVKSKEQGALERHLNALDVEVRAGDQQVEALREVLAREANERKVSDESLLDELRELRTALWNEMQERTAADEELAKSFTDRLNEEKAEWNQSHSALRGSVATAQKDSQQHRDEMPALRNQINELETTLVGTMKEQAKTLEKENGERSLCQQRLEKRVADLSTVLERNSSTQTALVEETEQMLKTVRTRMRTQINEAAEASRLAREALQRSVQEQIEKESLSREAQQESLIADFQGHKTAMTVRLDGIQKLLTDLDARNREATAAQARDLEAGQSKLLDDLARQVRELRDTFNQRLSEEKSAREAHDSSIEDHLEFLDRFLQDVRELFLSKGSRQRQLVRKPLAVGRSTTPLSSLAPTPQPLTPITNTPSDRL